MRAHTASRTTPARSRPGRPDVPVRAWLRLVHIFQKVQQATTGELRDAGLSVGQFDVLAQVGASEGLTQQQVADALLVTKSNVCQLLDRMERAGLVERQQHGRTNHLYLTEEGKRLYERIVPAHERHLAELFAGLSTEEQTTLLRVLRKLDHSLA
jgi:DNA-binding MarR family transcriptional regulator